MMCLLCTILLKKLASPTSDEQINIERFGMLNADGKMKKQSPYSGIQSYNEMKHKRQQSQNEYIRALL